MAASVTTKPITQSISAVLRCRVLCSLVHGSSPSYPCGRHENLKIGILDDGTTEMYEDVTIRASLMLG